MSKTAIIIGAGIAGLAAARALAVRKYQVTVIERNPAASGASVRNFGMVWPVGQPAGELYERAMLSRRIWKETSLEAGIWFEEKGSLHTAYASDEWAVLNELAGLYEERGCMVYDRNTTVQKFSDVNPSKLLGSFYSPDEVIVNPRQAIARIPAWLEEKYGVNFIWDRTVTEVIYPSVYSDLEVWNADLILICSGEDFNTLFPETYASFPITKCKLQMMRLASPGYRVGPALCGPLSLLHYDSFKAAASLPQMKTRYQTEWKEYLDAGIHVMVSQTETGELTVGDSHEYGPNPDPFIRIKINQLILDYFGLFTNLASLPVVETWMGVYPKMQDGSTCIRHSPEPGVHIINGLGGTGMTLSFGLMDQLAEGF